MRSALALAALVFALAALTGCSSAVDGRAQAVDHTAPYQQREQAAAATISGYLPGADPERFAIATCNALDVGLPMRTLIRIAQDARPDLYLTAGEARAAVLAATYGWCNQHSSEL